MRNKIARFLEWLARRLRVPDGLEIRQLIFDGDELSDDGPAAGVDVNTFTDADGAPWVELLVSKDRYLQISFRSLHRFMRKRVKS